MNNQLEIHPKNPKQKTQVQKVKKIVILRKWFKENGE